MDNSPRNIVFDLLLDFLSSNRSFKSIIEQKFKKINQLSNIDKSFIINISKGVLRYKKVLDFNISNYSKVKKIDNKTLVLLYVGSYQLLYCDGVPNYAAVDTTIELSKLRHKRSAKFINAILRKIEKSPFKINHNSNNKDFELVNFSYPEWITEKITDNYGEMKANQILKSSLKIPDIWFRVNLLKTDIKFVENILNENNIDFIQDNYLDFFLKVDRFDNKGILIKLVNDGFLYVQNPSSGHVVNLMGINNKDSLILDACASPGGKASLISQILKDENLLVCMDINKNRIDRLNSNLSVLGISNIKYLCDDASIYKTKKAYNKILLDLPCSSSGTIRKNPDIKWRLKKRKNE